MADGKAVGGDSAQRPFPKICAVHSVARVFFVARTPEAAIVKPLDQSSFFV